MRATGVEHTHQDWSLLPPRFAMITDRQHSVDFISGVWARDALFLESLIYGEGLVPRLSARQRRLHRRVRFVLGSELLNSTDYRNGRGDRRPMLRAPRQSVAVH